MNIEIQYFKTSAGELILGAYQNKLCLCDWRYRKQRETIDSRLKKLFKSDFIEIESEIIVEAKKQLSQYFNKSRIVFDIPLLFAGTNFQTIVWKALQKIEYGNTLSYLELSNLLENPKAIRAIASANGANAISIIVPCHRVIGSDGSLVGYAGGLKTKKQLLELEGAIIKNQYSLF